ncbi:MAG: ABC transporter permease [Clostridia bacterium]
MILDIIESSFRNIFRKKLRSCLTMLGIIIGVTSVILVFGIGISSKNAVAVQLNKFGLNGLIIKSVAANGKELPTISEENIKLIKRKVNDISYIMPIKSNFGKIMVKESGLDCFVWGIGENAKEVITLDTIYGKQINSYDIKNGLHFCIIDAKTAKDIFNTENAVGKEISISLEGSTSTYKVKGVVKADSSILTNVAGEYIPAFIYLPYTCFNSSNTAINDIIVSVKNPDDLDMVGDKIVSVLSNKNNIKDGYVANNMVKQKEKLDGIFNIITLLISAVAAISLFVSGLGIMTIMLVAVSERTREIGIKKSIGATKKNIVVEFICESLLITLSGGILGVVLSYIISVISKTYFAFEIIMTPQIIVLSLLFSAVIGIIFSVYPAKKAASLDPIIALRYE